MPDIYSGTNDGYVRTPLGDWATIRSTTTAHSAVSNEGRANRVVWQYYSSRGGGSYGILRAFFEFDTSGISVVPSSANLNILGYSQGNADIIVLRSTQSASLAASDFDALHNSSTELAASDGSGAGTLAGVSGLTYSAEITSWNTSGSYNTITLNATALSDIADLDTFKVCIIEYDHDYLDITHTSSLAIGAYFSDNSGTSKDPYLSYVAGGAAVTDNSVFFGCNF